ncbi:hypothetical protein LOTGIDRAFT_104408, partial [Lottia gigantea]
DGFLLVYSISERFSFESALRINGVLQKVRGNSETPIVLVGNKTDRSVCREVTISYGRDLAFDLGSAFYETSCYFDPVNIKSVFHDVIRQVRCVRMRSRSKEQACTTVRGFIHRLSFKGKRKSLKSSSSSSSTS